MANPLVVCQYANHRAAICVDITEEHHRQSCEKFGYRYYLVREEKDNPWWGKQDTIEEVIRTGAERIVWLDADTIWLGDQPLEPEIDFIGLVYHNHPEQPHWNAGVIYLKGTTGQLTDLFARWRAGPKDGHGWTDQYGLNLMINRGDVKVSGLDARWNSCIHIPAYRYPGRPVVAAWHGHSSSNRAVPMHQYMVSMGLPTRDLNLHSYHGRIKVMERESWYYKRMGTMKGRTFIDAGANQGMWSRAMSSQFQRVIAIESNYEIYSELKKNVPNNVQCINRAAWKANEPVRMYLHKIACDSVVNYYDSPPTEMHLGMSIDSLKLDDVDLIKLDVEGAELDVMQGAEETVMKCRPVLLIEVHNTNDEPARERKVHAKLNEWKYLVAMKRRDDIEPHKPYRSEYWIHATPYEG